MKFLSFLLLIHFSVLLHAQKKEESILWNESRILEWTDYKAKPDQSTSFKALTGTGLSFGVQYENQLIIIRIENHFYPQQSWTKNKENDELLGHERLHFDIAELFARKLRQEILTTTFKEEGQKLMNRISDIYAGKVKELSAYQKEYDKETLHSINKDLQKEWEEKVRKELKKLEEYSSPTLTILLE